MSDMSNSHENGNTSPKPTTLHKLDAGLETKEGKKTSRIPQQTQHTKHARFHARSELEDFPHIEAGPYNEEDGDSESKSTELYECSISLSKTLRLSESFRRTPSNGSGRGPQDVTDPILMDSAIIYSRKKTNDHGKILLHCYMDSVLIM